LIDASPEMRQSCLTYHISHVNAIVLTHFHEDNVGGLNDLRPLHLFHGEHKIHIFLSQETHKIVSIRFGYLMDRFEVHLLENKEGKITIAGE
ncbi:MBL fold metallo-hydrolase, partial [Staphylococcus aureus]